MSKTKKVLSLVMAIALMFNVLAIASSAACADGKLVGFTAETADKLVAGGTVTVDFYIELPAGTDYSAYKLGLFQLIVSYNKDILTPVTRTWGDTYAEFMASTNGFNTTTSTVHRWISSYLTTEEAAKYTGSCAIAGSQVDNTNSYGYTGSTGYCIKSLKDKMFSITFKVAADYDGTSSADVAILQKSFQNATRAYLRDITGNGGGKLNKDGSQVDWSDSAVTLTAAASATPSVTHDKTMGQMKSWAANEGPFNGGLVGRISNLPLTFDASDNCNEIKDIEVTITTSSGSKSAKAYTVYKQADGSYLFRAVLKNMNITDEETLTCTYAVTRADDTVIYSDPFTTTAKQMYDTALANYNAANP